VPHDRPAHRVDPVLLLLVRVGHEEHRLVGRAELEGVRPVDGVLGALDGEAAVDVDDPARGGVLRVREGGGWSLLGEEKRKVSSSRDKGALFFFLSLILSTKQNTHGSDLVALEPEDLALLEDEPAGGWFLGGRG